MTNDKLRDLLLGYDDAGRAATEDEMALHFCLYAMTWRPARFVDLVSTSVNLRDPRTESERKVVKEAAAAIERAVKSSRAACRKTGGK